MIHRQPSRRHAPLTFAVGCVALVSSSVGYGQTAVETTTLPAVEVIATTPLPGSGAELRDVPANAQIFRSRDLRREGSPEIGDFLERNAGSVGINSSQGNPYQPDVNLRGFTASPLLGTPQGISVFLDGVRLNEPFGDSVNWDLLIPESIASIELLPGTNPAFGLNTLGGAILVTTRSGASEFSDHPGATTALRLGSFGRRTLVVATGGERHSWDWYAAGDDTRDPGWASHDASRLHRLFAKLGWQDERTRAELSLRAADNRLDGMQTVPASFDDPTQAYTYPDTNINRAVSTTLNASRTLDGGWIASGHVYLRSFRNRNVSSNVNDDAASDPLAAAAANDRATIDQTSEGLAFQLSGDAARFGRHHVTLGASLDAGKARFKRSSQPADFTSDRGTIAIGAFEPEADSDSSTRYLGAYASDAWRFAERWTLTLAGRYDRADIRIGDRSGNAPALDGAHRFTRLNPAAGLTFTPSKRLTAYTSYSEGMRAPTAIELTCADPAAPCKLPNEFLADPALKKVVSKTVELGARGMLGHATSWSAALYRTDLDDDIQFISTNGVAVNAGYFQNVGTTRRQGLELAASTRLGALDLTARYAWLDATFRTGFAENSPANSSADANGTILVRRGDRIPGIPRQLLKLRADYAVREDMNLGINALASSAIRARGDENGLDAHGQVGGYLRIDVDGQWRPHRACAVRPNRQPVRPTLCELRSAGDQPLHRIRPDVRPVEPAIGALLRLRRAAYIGSGSPLDVSLRRCQPPCR